LLAATAVRYRILISLLAACAFAWAVGVYLNPAQAGQPGAPGSVPTSAPTSAPTEEPGEPGEPPNGDELVKTPGKGAKVYALTFDDGPDPKWTPMLLDILDKHQVKAMFCLVGTQVEAHPALVKTIAAKGHRLCNHSYKHDHLGGMDPATVRADLEKTNKAIKAVVPDAKIEFMRAPYGEWGPGYGEPGVVSREAAKLGMKSLFWNVDSNDWRYVNNPNGAAEMFPAMKVLLDDPQTQQSGAVILLHDAGHADRSQSLKVVDEYLVPYFEQHGWKADFPG
jgi:peptidoglycan-N-acetylglucosamine deacetylase